MLEAIKEPCDLRRHDEADLKQIADELRTETINAVAVTGGHLGAGLGVVELTVALHYVFDTPADRLIWDVGHQAYPHKILTGRRDRIRTLRQGGGLSGFTKRAESEYDPFGAAHSSTSISAALGMAVARDLAGEKHNVIAVIGDGAMSAGMAYEAMNNAGARNERLIVILNDNDMSIAPPVGAMSAYLARLGLGRTYLSLRDIGKQLAQHLPKFARPRHYAGRASTPAAMSPAARCSRSWASIMSARSTATISITCCRCCGTCATPRRADPRPCRDAEGQGLRAGRGLEPTSITASSSSTSRPASRPRPRANAPSYTKVFGESLVKEARKDDKIVAITAAMPSGTGVDIFEKAFPKRTFDVGIAEQHAVTFAAGLATEGFKPFCAIYSTFLQRAYDQVVHDVAIQRLPVRFALDRAGLVGADGPTHAGSFDVAYLGCLPGFVLMAAADEAELVHMVATAVAIDDRPSALRYPRGEGVGVDMPEVGVPLEIGKGRILREGHKVALLSSARGSPNASRRPTSSPRSACRPRLPTRASPSRSTST